MTKKTLESLIIKIELLKNKLLEITAKLIEITSQPTEEKEEYGEVINPYEMSQYQLFNSILMTYPESTPLVFEYYSTCKEMYQIREQIEKDDFIL